jgi:hypothetical protein
VVSPDPDSITAAMLRAMLRDQKFGSTDVKVITTRYQDAVPFYVEYGFAQAGATAAKAVAKSWTSKGGKILLTSRPTPIKQFIASSRAVRGRRRESAHRSDDVGAERRRQARSYHARLPRIRSAESRRRTEGDRLARPVRRRAPGPPPMHRVAAAPVARR